jgi:hypothetical protein
LISGFFQPKGAIFMGKDNPKDGKSKEDFGKFINV